MSLTCKAWIPWETIKTKKGLEFRAPGFRRVCQVSMIFASYELST